MAAALVDRYPQETPMAITAENLAARSKVSRQECDAWALKTQQRWKAAFDAGVFKDEIVPVTVKSRKGPEEVSVGK